MVLYLFFREAELPLEVEGPRRASNNPREELFSMDNNSIGSQRIHSVFVLLVDRGKV